MNVIESLLQDLTLRIQESSKCQSVAIRLNEESDYPYYSQIGFPQSFIEKENLLNPKDQKGKLVVDTNGIPVLECMCGNVLRRRVNPKYQYFTEEGAFWTNSTTQLLQSLTEKERQEIGRTRNTCHNYGYESVALIPIHAKNKTVGLIQINDPCEDMFTLDEIKEYQSLADNLGTLILNILKFYEKIGEIANPSSENQNVEK